MQKRAPSPRRCVSERPMTICRECWIGAGFLHEAKPHDVSLAIKRYGDCISFSKGEDNCGAEFAKLMEAQKAFAAGVSEFKSECD